QCGNNCDQPSGHLERGVADTGDLLHVRVRLGDALQRQASGDERPQTTLAECAGDVRPGRRLGRLGHGVHENRVYRDVLGHEHAEGHAGLVVAARGVTRDDASWLEDLQRRLQIATEVHVDYAVHTA